MHFSLVGVLGSGMCSLANILIDLGHEVDGYDYDKKYFTSSLLRKNVNFYKMSELAYNTDTIYIIGNVYKKSNFVKELIKKNVKFYYYYTFIEEFFNMPKVGVSGSHGKTSIVCFIGTLLDKKKVLLSGDGNGYSDKEPKLMIFEACEYCDTFLNYTYDYLVINNIDYDHPDYFKSEAQYISSFSNASKKAKKLIINNDCPNCKKISHLKKITYGFSIGSDFRMRRVENNMLEIQVQTTKFRFIVPFLSNEYLYNFTAAFVVSYYTSNNINNVLNNVSKIKLPKRRLNELYCKKNDLILIDDYAHHPKEIKVSISEIRKKYPDKKLIAVFQPHTLSRTKAFLFDFIKALRLADDVYIMSVFSSIRESETKDNPILKNEPLFKAYERNLLPTKDVVILFMGAGDIDKEIDYFVKQ